MTPPLSSHRHMIKNKTNRATNNYQCIRKYAVYPVSIAALSKSLEHCYRSYNDFDVKSIQINYALGHAQERHVNQYTLLCRRVPLHSHIINK